MNIAITGHRPNKLGNDYDLVSPLIKSIKSEIVGILSKYYDIEFKQFPEVTLITGMALGIDTLFAQIAIELNIPFIAAIPFIGQERKWPSKSQKTYHYLLSKAYEVVNCAEKDTTTIYEIPRLMQKRNEWMVNNCDVLISVWDGSNGGTANCTTYAQNNIDNKIGRVKQIIRVNPKEITV